MIKSRLQRSFMIFLLVVATIGITCATTTKERIHDEALPASPTVTADTTKLYLKPEKIITISKDKKKANSVIVVIAATREATKITDTDKYGRMIRKTLLEKGVKVITGEVRAKIEEYKEGSLQSRKETLQEAEKLILLGKVTGADAILVFDYIGMATESKDIYLNIDPETEQITITVKGISSDKPDPEAIRKILPALVVRGRLVDAETASISAEFDLVTYFFRNEQELQSQIVRINKYRYDPVTKSDVYYASQGCSKRAVKYTYIASYAPIDIRQETISRILDKYIPHINEIDTVQADKKLDEFLRKVIDEIV
jgi:hypothetical protein